MAIYHCSAQVLSRSQGRSAVAAAAYRSGERIRDERYGKTADYRTKSVAHKEVLAPVQAPEWALDRAKLWNAAEAAENRKNSQVAREIRVALPRELSDDQQLEMVRGFCKEQFVQRGMVADLCIHRDNRMNPHAHIMLTMRSLEADGFAKKKDRSWNDRSLYKEWRAEWAQSCNFALEQAGHNIQIDHRSYEEQGIRLTPSIHHGVSGNLENEKRDVHRERIADYYRILRENSEAIQRDPTIALDAITKQRSTFTELDIALFVNKHSDEYQPCFDAIMKSEQLVQLGVDERNGRIRYSTKEMRRVEKDLLRRAVSMAEKKGHRVGEKAIEIAASSRTMSEEQRRAFDHIIHGGDVAVVEGYAGAGKSYMLGAVREAYEAQGYRVLGGALAGKAAEGLEDSAGIKSRSLHSWEYAWKKGKEALSKKDILVIDEAAMVGTWQLQRILQRADEAGAKVILVGDRGQLQAIEAGAPMRAIGDTVGICSLKDILRQQKEWQREAVRKLGDQDVRGALREFDKRGCIVEHKETGDAISQVVSDWNESWLEDSKKSQMMLAYRRADVERLNISARRVRLMAGELGSDKREVETADGKKSFRENDRIYFLKNDRMLGVMNGSLGTVQSIGQNISVKLDSGKVVTFDPEQYNHVNHGYACTVHKSQGMTVDRAHVLASRLFDSNSAYVALSRQRTEVKLHYSLEEFGSRSRLEYALSRSRPKEMALDFDEVYNLNKGLSEQIAKQNAVSRDVVHTKNVKQEQTRSQGRDFEYAKIGHQLYERRPVEKNVSEHQQPPAQKPRKREVNRQKQEHHQVMPASRKPLAQKVEREPAAPPQQKAKSKYQQQLEAKYAKLSPSQIRSEQRNLEQTASKEPLSLHQAKMLDSNYLDARHHFDFHSRQTVSRQNEIAQWKKEHPIARIAGGPKDLRRFLKTHEKEADFAKEYLEKKEADPSFQRFCKQEITRSKENIKQARQELAAAKPIFEQAKQHLAESIKERVQKLRQEKNQGRGWER